MVAASVEKVETPWNQFATGDLPVPSPAQKLFTETVITVAATAKATLGSLNGRVDKARDLVLAGLVTRQADYSFVVRSESSKSKSYVVDADGHCDCPDAQKPDKRCKHLLATWIWRRARAQVEAQALHGMVTPPATPAVNGITPTPGMAGFPSTVVQSTSALATDAPVAAPPVVSVSVPQEFLVQIHGKPYIRFIGLLHIAHQRGLVSLKAEFTNVTPQLALARAVATFADGRVFEEAADSMPENCGKEVRPHWPRMALVRAKCRALRDALDLDLCAVEEVE
jgi:hypothetical protein